MLRNTRGAVVLITVKVVVAKAACDLTGTSDELPVTFRQIRTFTEEMVVGTICLFADGT